VSLFFTHESPNFVGLHVGNFDVSDARFKQPLAMLARQLEHGKYGLQFDPAQPRSGTGGIAFHQAMEDSGHRLFWEPHVSSERLYLRFDEPLAALLALVPLDLVSALTGFDRFDSAIVARHANLL